MKKTVEPVNVRPQEHEPVKLKLTGNVTEIMYMKRRNNKCPIQKLNKEEYIFLDTGEIKEFKHGENRADDLNQVRVSQSKLRDYLNTNITEVNKCRWITLTYAENMKDTQRLLKDYERFVKRLRYKLGKFEYIVAMEPQGRGAWHCHAVLIFDNKAPYIPNNELADAWGNGFVTVKKIENVDNVGAYLTAYLCDMDYEEAQKNNCLNDGPVKEIEITDEYGNKTSKKIIKGARLKLYPKGFKLYRCSKGIKKPEIENTTEKMAQKKISAATLTFERTIKLNDEETGFNNTINYRYYNTLRNKINTGD